MFYCPSCRKEKELIEFHTDRSKLNSRSTYCRICENEKAKKRRKQNPERDRTIRRKSYYKHQKQHILASRQHYYENQEEEKRKSRNRHRANPQDAKDRHRRVKLKAIQIVSAEMKCRYCGESDPNLLEIDHVRGDGGAIRAVRRNIHYALVRDGLPKNTELQILCEKHNAMKSWLSDEEFRNEVHKLHKLFT